MSNEELGIVLGDLSMLPKESVFLDGSNRSCLPLKTAAIGIGSYKPGWRWFEHVGPQLGKPSARHIGYVISGSFVVRDNQGNEEVAGPGQALRWSLTMTLGL